jgi:hypothetical protein
MRHWNILGSKLGRSTDRAGTQVRASRPFRGLGAWADHESSWAVPPEDIPDDEPDVLY